MITHHEITCGECDGEGAIETASQSDPAGANRSQTCPACRSVGPRVVKTEYIFPPIPIRTEDWMAWFDDDDETGPHGFGETEADAIEDLMQWAWD